MWIAGVLILAGGVLAYLVIHPAPVGTEDTAGTIVEAKRVISENSATSPAPTAPKDSTDK